MVFFCLVECGTEPSALSVGFGETCLNFAELGARGGQRVFTFRQPPCQTGGLVQRLIDRDL